MRSTKSMNNDCTCVREMHDAMCPVHLWRNTSLDEAQAELDEKMNRRDSDART